MSNDLLPALPGFRVIRRLGRGPTGDVYLARRLQQQDLVAVKVLVDPPGRQGRIRAVCNSARRAMACRHPAIAAVLDVIEDDERRLLVMEYAAGDTLGRALQRNVRFPLQRALAIVRRLAEGLQAGRQHGLVHGAIHPDQIILDDDRPRLLGVGLGEILPDTCDGPLSAGRFSPLIYASPEVLQRQVPSAQSDIASLGLILYHLLTGYPPFRGNSLGALHRARREGKLLWPRGAVEMLGDKPVQLVARMTSTKPARRLADYDQVLGSLKLSNRPPALPAKTRNEIDTPQVDTSLPVVKTLAPLPSKPAPHHVRRLPFGIATAATIAVFLLSIAVALQSMVRSSAPVATSPEDAAADKETPSADPAPGPEAAPASRPSAPQPPADDPAPKKQPPTPRERYDTLLRALAENPDDADVRQRVLQGLQALRDEAPQGRVGILAAAHARRLERGLANRYEELYRIITRRADGYVGDQRFGDAIAKLAEQPGDPAGAAWQEKARHKARRIAEELAPQAYARVQKQAQRLEARGALDEARALYVLVVERYGLEPYVQQAQAEVDRLSDLLEQRAIAEQTRREQEHLATLQRQMPALFAAVRSECRAFRYDEALARLRAQRLQVARQRDLAAKIDDYILVVKQEQWFHDLVQERIARGQARPAVRWRDKPDACVVERIDQRGVHMRPIGAVAVESDTPQDLVITLSWSQLGDDMVVELFAAVRSEESGDEALGQAIMAFHRNEPWRALLREAVELDPTTAAAAARYERLFGAVEAETEQTPTDSISQPARPTLPPKRRLRRRD